MCPLSVKAAEFSGLFVSNSNKQPTFWAADQNSEPFTQRPLEAGAQSCWSEYAFILIEGSKQPSLGDAVGKAEPGLLKPVDDFLNRVFGFMGMFILIGKPGSSFCTFEVSLAQERI